MRYNSTTTLRRIRDANPKPCENGWKKLLKGLGKTAADDVPLSVTTILDINGLDDALWTIDHALSDDRLKRHLKAAYVERILPIYEAEHPGDTRIHDQITMLRNDSATDEERQTTLTAAQDAYWGIDPYNTQDAAQSAARAAISYFVWEAARDASRAAFWSEECDTACNVAWSEECDAQERILRDMLGEE